MRLLAQSHIANHYAAPTEIMAKVEVARAPGQTILSESLSVTPFHALAADDLGDGRLLRGVVEGNVEIVYRALVEVEPRVELHPDLQQHAWSDLPADVLPYLLPSRYCPADQFLRFAAREFGTLTGGGKAIAIVDWLRGHLDYVHGVSNAASPRARSRRMRWRSTRPISMRCSRSGSARAGGSSTRRVSRPSPG